MEVVTACRPALVLVASGASPHAADPVQPAVVQEPE
jgi:hypothetical protein